MSAKKSTLSHRRSICWSAPFTDDGKDEGDKLLHRVPANDDQAERLERRHNRVHELQQPSVPSPKPVDVDKCFQASSLSGFTSEQLADHYANCIRLSTENKITMKNAFGLHLIDYMAEMLQKNDSEMNNLQVASCTLDASAKIYAYRVDCIHAETQRIASGLTWSGNGKRDRSESDIETTDGAGDLSGNKAHDKKRKRKRGSTIEHNPSSLNANKVDLQCEVDPLFNKTTELFAGSGAGSAIMLSALNCRDDRCEIILSSLEPNRNENPVAAKQSSVDISQLSSLFRTLTSKSYKICPEFSDFTFGSWKPGDSVGSPWKFDDDMIPTQRQNDDELEEDNVGLECESAHMSDSEPVASSPTTMITKVQTPIASYDSEGMDLIQMLATKPTEYSYFIKGFESAWAGPSHWHVRPISNATSKTNKDAKPAKQRTKKPLVELDFIADLPDLDMHFVPTQLMSLTLSRVKRQRWTEANTTLSEDIHYDIKCFQQMLFKPLVYIRMTDDGDLLNNNIHNDDSLCHSDDVGDDCAFSNDVPGPTQDTNYASPSTPLQQCTAFTFIDDNLVQQPLKVAKLDIPYARVAKRVNVRAVKESMWKMLSFAEEEPSTSTSSLLPSQQERMFSNIYRHLPCMLSTEQSDNLSVPIAFVCMLHLANEKNLELVPLPNMTDFQVFMYNEQDAKQFG